jgi:hypothetical protein
MVDETASDLARSEHSLKLDEEAAGAGGKKAVVKQA